MKWFKSFLLLIPIVLLIPITPAETNPTQIQTEIKPPSEDVKTFPLKEISAFDLTNISDFKRGQYSETKKGPDPLVKKYPQIKSQNPIYGKFEFGKIYGEKDSGFSYQYVLDESSGTGHGYDLMYFDINRDLDLTNDQPLKPLASPPKGAVFGYNYIEKEIFFQYLNLAFDVGSGVKLEREFFPHLIIQKDSGKGVFLISTKLKSGNVEIAGQKFTAYLGHSYSIGPSFDWQGTALHLVPENIPNAAPRWWGAENIKALHLIPDTDSGTFYRFSTTPQGDRLIVQPYTGDLGVFKIGAGNRNLDKMEVAGSLCSRDANVAVGTLANDSGWPKPAPSCTIPVGDYYPNYISVYYGKLRISISQNYHSDGKSRDIQDRPLVYGMTVRKDKPYILDFTNKPVVMFASPPKDHRVKTGEKLTIEAVLIDPALDIMIRGLDDTTRKNKTDGFERDFSLDPTVVITRADGEIVAQGEMPFG